MHYLWMETTTDRIKGNSSNIFDHWVEKIPLYDQKTWSKTIPTINLYQHWYVLPEILFIWKK